MTGPQHYKEAEKAAEAALQPGLEVEWVMARLARAQVHATLALAAATVQRQVDIDGQSVDHWAEVTA